MSNNKQSSVEWFFNQLVANRIIVINGTTYWDKVKAKYEILLEQAKAMNKEQHRQTANVVRQAIFDLNYSSFDEYYNETFGGNNDQL